LYDQERATVQRLRELDSLKTDFLSTARHELRTPLTAIMGQLEVLKLAWDQWAENTKLEYLEDIEISTRLLDELLETMLDYSLVSGNVSLQFASVRLVDAVRDALADIDSHFKGGLPVSVDIDAPEEIHLHADPRRLRQVVRAVLDNSVKFAQRGQVTIKARTVGDSALIDLHDTGVGISETALPQIFDAFFQEDNSGTRTFGGLGMGLALAKRLTDAHGAQISAISTVGSGTTVTLLWPLANHKDQPEQLSTDGFHRVR
jgi:signal transduction histidine kinase